VAQFWSFANDIYLPEEGKRLFAIVAFGASAGAVLGSVIAEKLIEPIGVEQMLLVAAAVLVSTLAITNWIDAREKRRLAANATGKKEDSPEEKIGKGRAFRLVWSTRYLLLIAFLILFLNWVNTTGEYILGRVVSADAAAKVAAGAAGGLSEKDLVGKFYASFFKIVNIVGLTVQLFFVSRIIKWFGIRFSILALPIVALGGYATIAFLPVLSMIRWVKTAENSLDYSLNNTVRQALFLPLTREQKYNAKQAIDTFFWRAGDLLSAGLVFLGTQVLAFKTQHFAMVNMVLVVVWIMIAFWTGRENAKMTGEAEEMKHKGAGASRASRAES
jgi:AAA family ATP:ADP antiporter